MLQWLSQWNDSTRSWQAFRSFPFADYFCSDPAIKTECQREILDDSRGISFTGTTHSNRREYFPSEGPAYKDVKELEGEYHSTGWKCRDDHIKGLFHCDSAAKKSRTKLSKTGKTGDLPTYAGHRALWPYNGSAYRRSCIQVFDWNKRIVLPSYHRWRIATNAHQ